MQGHLPFYSKKSTASKRRVRSAIKNKAKRGCFSKLVRSRLQVLMVFIVLGFSLIGSRMVWVGFVPVDEPEASVSRIAQELPVRGNIYDRNGLLMATTLKVKSLYADPKMMLDVNETSAALEELFPDVNMERVRKRMQNRKRRFVWVKRQLTPAQVRAVNNLGHPGLGFKEEEARIYPHGKLFAHVLGGMNVDGDGLAGIEKSYNDQLNNGEDVHLTVDVKIQEQLRHSLLENIERTEAKASWGLVTSAKNGNVLAMVSLPDYDPNRLGEAPKDAWMNRTIKGAYEMGSIFKIFTMAQGINEGYVHRDTPLDVRKPIRIGRFTIRDFHPRYEIMPLDKAFRRSSNVGSAKVADMFGPEAQQHFYQKLGLLEPITVGLNETGRPLTPKNWKRIQMMTMSFGHGIAVTPVHMAAAVGAVVNDGMYRAPNIVKGREIAEPVSVITPETVAEVRYLMEDVVQNGTGRKGGIKGFSIGGKTGTAEKNVGGRYLEDKNLASFIGVMPMDDPELITLMMVDEGKEGANTGSSAAAPAFKQFAQRLVPMLGLRPELNPMDTNSFDIKRASYASF